MVLKDKLISMRKAVGFTQQELAELLGVDRSTYACYENGKANIPVNKLQLLSIIYNIDLSAFITSEVLVLHSGDNGNNNGSDEEKLNQIEKDERFLIAQYRVIKAMGKQEELLKLVDEMTYDEE